MNSVPVSSQMRNALRAWLSLDNSNRLTYLELVLRGFRRRGCFASARYPLLGRNVWINRRFGQIFLGSFVHIGDGAGVSVFGPDRDHVAALHIGDHANIGGGTRINCSLLVSIGSHCAISWDCEILDTDIHRIVFEDGSSSQPEPVVIEDRVWLGARSIVVKGVRIGEGSVIGAGSVVTRDIPPHCLAAGNPARPIKTIREWLP